MSPLFEAIEKGDLSAAQRLLAEGADPNQVDDGRSPLTDALFSDNEPMVRLLLQAGADVNFCPEHGASPLYAAETVALTALLIEAGARVSLESGMIWDSPCYSLNCAAESGNRERLELLLNEADGKSFLDKYNFMGWTVTGCAANAGKANTLELLLSQGADPNLSDLDRIADTPLALAASNGHLDAVRVLLAFGADPDHSWGLCSTGRRDIENFGGKMLALLHHADKQPKGRIVTSESVRRMLRQEIGSSVGEPTGHVIDGNKVWVFGNIEGPSLAWNWKWGIVKRGRVRWYESFTEATTGKDYMDPRKT